MPSAAWRNADARYRERERRKLRAVESGGLYNELSTSPEWDGFFGALHDQQDLAQAAGMNYRVNLGDIGRPGFEGMDPGGRPNNKFLAQTLAAEDVSRRLQAANAERDEYNRQRQQAVLNDLDTMYINHVMASDMAPPVAPYNRTDAVGPSVAPAPDATGLAGMASKQPSAGSKFTIRETPQPAREAILNKIPRGAVALRAQYEKQFADEDARAKQIQLEEAGLTETSRHNKAMETVAASGRPMTATAEANLISRLAKQWEDTNKTSTEMERQFKIMQTGLDRFEADPNGASQAVLVTFQKMLDPESVVRESEYARSSQGISLMGRMRGYMEKLSRGGAGVPKKELTEMVETARQFRENTKDAPEARRARIAATLDRYNLPHEVVFFQSGGAAPAVPAAAPAPPAGGQQNSGGGIVKMQAPDGSVGYVSAGQVAAAEAKGAKRVQ